MRRSPHKTALAVTPDPRLGRVITAVAHRCGFHVVLVSNFEEAKALLAGGPELLITELKLGPFNGIHLALRARASQTHTIVIGDPEFRRDVMEHGATWISPFAVLDGYELAAALSSAPERPFLPDYPGDASAAGAVSADATASSKIAPPPVH